MGKAQQINSDTRREILARAYFLCEYCGGRFDSLNIHHRTPRGMGGTRVAEINQPANLLALCGSGTTGCHGWVESNREQAYELGLLVRRGQSGELVPFQNKNGEWYTILNDGTKMLWIKTINDTQKTEL